MSQADEGAAEGVQFALMAGGDIPFEGTRSVHVVAAQDAPVLVVDDVIGQGNAGGLTDVIGFLQQRPEFFLALGLGEGSADRCPVICRQDVVSAVKDEFTPYFHGDILCDTAGQPGMVEDVVDLLRRLGVV